MNKELLNAGVNKFLDISIGHISKHDNDLLKKMANPSYYEVLFTCVKDFFKTNLYELEPPLVVCPHEFGYWVYVSIDLSNADSKLIDALIHFGFSIEFCEILIAANELDCIFVNFDRDGLQYEGLKFFNWD